MQIKHLHCKLFIVKPRTRLCFTRGFSNTAQRHLFSTPHTRRVLTSGNKTVIFVTSNYYWWNTKGEKCCDQREQNFELVQHLQDNLHNTIWLSFRLFLRKVLIFVKSKYGNLRNDYHIRNGNKKPTNLPIPSKIKVKTSHNLTYTKITEKKALKTALNSLEILIVNLRTKCFKSLPANQN